MKKKTVMLPVEVPEGDYCMKIDWGCDISATVQKCCFFSYGHDTKKCIIFKESPEFREAQDIDYYHKLPACLEAGEEVQRNANIS